MELAPLYSQEQSEEPSWNEEVDGEDEDAQGTGRFARLQDSFVCRRKSHDKGLERTATSLEIPENYLSPQKQRRPFFALPQNMNSMTRDGGAGGSNTSISIQQLFASSSVEESSNPSFLQESESTIHLDFGDSVVSLENSLSSSFGGSSFNYHNNNNARLLIPENESLESFSSMSSASTMATAVSRRGVTFGPVKERYHPMTLGHHPCANAGLGVTLSWDYDPECKEFSLDQHQKIRNGGLRALSTASKRRIALCNHSISTIFQTIDEMKAIQASRLETERELEKEGDYENECD